MTTHPLPTTTKMKPTTPPTTGSAHPVCLELQKLNTSTKAEYAEDIIKLRKLEEVIKAQAVNSPADHLVIMHDGTSALVLPCLSRRSIKNLDPFRFEVTPWPAMDYSSGDLKDYIYSTSWNTPKEANTLISQVHLVIRRAKSDYTHPLHRARTLTLMADSASENKNNTLFMYCTDLVNNGSFDEVILLFGPVGHTHNGVDASHKVYN
jgi:hypothetical protein